jgi:hypothetical protein
MAQPVQTFRNHARLLPAFHFFVLPVLFFNVVNALRHLLLAPSLSTAFAVLVAAALVTLAFTARLMALKVQDRVIRLEMRMRLGEILPAELRARVADLSPAQLVALRFACDAEKGDLVREVLEGKLQTQKEIKMRVKQWQGDWLRA